MTPACFSAEMLERWESSPEVARHAGSCARCFALLTSYQSFLAAEPIAAADVEDAERRLSDALERHSNRVARRSPRRARRVLEPAAWVAAAAALLLFAILPRYGSDPEQMQLRGESSLREVQPESLQLLSPQPDGDGWLLRWDFVEEADHYELRLYDVDLEELQRFSMLWETQLRLEDVPDAALWRVYAYRDDQLIAMSAVGTLHH